MKADTTAVTSHRDSRRPSSAKSVKSTKTDNSTGSDSSQQTPAGDKGKKKKYSLPSAKDPKFDVHLRNVMCNYHTTTLTHQDDCYFNMLIVPVNNDNVKDTFTEMYRTYCQLLGYTAKPVPTEDDFRGPFRLVNGSYDYKLLIPIDVRCKLDLRKNVDNEVLVKNLYLSLTLDRDSPYPGSVAVKITNTIIVV